MTPQVESLKEKSYLEATLLAVLSPVMTAKICTFLMRLLQTPAVEYGCVLSAAMGFSGGSAARQ